MSRHSSLVGLVLSILLVVVLATPTIQWATQLAPRGSLYGYTDEIPGRPINLAGAFFNKTLQPWVKQYFDVNLGFRPFLVRTFNEITFTLFRETNRMRLVSTSSHGLHSHLSIVHLNTELTNKVELERQYQVEAQKLLLAQQMLAARGKYFEVVIATSKTYAYPEELGRRFLVGDAAGVFTRAASFGNALKAAGVNVTDSGPELRRFAIVSGMETHAASGLHWNFYSGCIIASRILDNARERRFPAAPSVDCGTPRLESRRDTIDVDGLNLLNIWSDGGLLRPTPYPSVLPVRGSAWRPSIVFIGDSFSYQMRLALQQANAYSRLVLSSYFSLREVDDRIINQVAVVQTPSAEADGRGELLADIMGSDMVILEMVDYNVSRFGYGFADYIVEKLR